MYVTIGYMNELENINTSLPCEGTLHNESELLININQLYENTVLDNDKNTQKFDLMIFREHRETLLWNCVLLFKHYELPYDFILPFEDSEPKYIYDKVNEHTKVREVLSVDEI